MDITLIALVAFFAVAAYFAFKLVKSAISMATMVVTAIVILSVLGGFLAVNDAKEINGNLGNSTKTFLAVSNDEVISGFTSNTSFAAMSNEELANWSAAVKKNAAGNKASSKNMVFIFNESVLQSNPDKEIKIDSSLSVSKKKLADAMVSSSAIDSFAAIINISPDVIRIKYSENDLKARIFGYIAADEFTNVTDVDKDIRSGGIRVYPDSPAIIAIKLLPLWHRNIADMAYGKKR